MDKKEKIEFPKGFFSIKRTEISTEEVMNDIIPIKWSKEVVEKSKKAVVYSVNSNKIKSM